MVKHISWICHKKLSKYVINFNFDESRMYDDWFIKISGGRLEIGINRDTLEADYDP